MKDFWISFALTAMKTAGMSFKMQDANNTGSDDMIGGLLNSGSSALEAYLRGDIKGFRSVLKTIADSIYTFLETP